MDVELFDQMLRNNAYSAENLHNLVSFVFTRMASLEVSNLGRAWRVLMHTIELLKLCCNTVVIIITLL
jgi:hypothetical protein